MATSAPIMLIVQQIIKIKHDNPALLGHILEKTTHVGQIKQSLTN